ncbi:guanylate cyclase 32E [Cimex lectularius]|uniref:Guanylate cyclase n=1 Tax=Cimex lectularius TaxID=79782 RepID=A0A8I6SD13_CIMLE|nr:guanylate cyclase 32E [Cimex lectularius]
MAAVIVFYLTFSLVLGEELLLGYLTGSQRREGDNEYSRPGLTISGAISLAVQELNESLLKNNSKHSLRFIVAETMGEEAVSIRQTAYLWTQNITGYIGPQETCIHEARMAAAFNLPMISYFCTNYETSDKRLFPTFARTRPPDTQISKSVAAVLLAFNWTQVTFLYRNSSDLGTVADTIMSVLDSSGVTILATRTWTTSYLHGYTDNPFAQMVAQTYTNTRIYLILGQYDEHLGLLVAMEDIKLFDNGEYWVVGVDIVQYDEKEPTKYLKGLLVDEIQPAALHAFRSYLGVAPSPPTNLTKFASQVNKYMELPPFNFPNPVASLGGGKQISEEAAYLYDAVQLYVKGVLEAYESGEDIRNGTAIIERLKCRHYQSAMGYMVYMDSNGDAEGNYTLLARKMSPTGEYGLFPVGGFSYKQTTDSLPELNLASEIDWVNGEIPIAVPPCGFSGEKCISHTMEVVGGIAGASLAFLIITALVLYRNWRYEQELDSLLWKIDFKEIQMNEELSVTNELKTNRIAHPLIRTSQVSLTSNPDADFRYTSIFTTIGIYKGRVFAIKRVNKKSIDITRSMKKELKLMRDLRHDNLNAFIGACTDPPNICIVTEYCNRGSLKDIIENEDVKLDNMFIASLVGDILRGLIYLQDSTLRFHGNLKSSNCLVDSRWVVKLSDFGLKEFKSGEDDFHQTWSLKHTCDEENKCKCEGLLYRAPELLRVTTATPGAGSQKGDVYSFGIILYELHSRKGPFNVSTGLTPRQIVHRIMFPPPNSPPFRPPLDQLEVSFDYVRDCLKECWFENPEERPDIKTVRSKLRPMRKGMKPNIFDNMMAMMEAYANNLEVLVDERTDQLIEEKKKTEALLFEMLPRCVADQLRKGHKVEAESFDCVTIYFSDIVGFTAMSAESTPLQVVDFLNDLYTCFDSIIVNYDVYKVETIGDAYMVVSGLPVRNHDQHAAEIASLSLDMLHAVTKFKIRHRPKDKLKIRIGLHSGPVCAGVVGKKMPRYCLFGDTVNTASRMESTGLAQKIHCSIAVKELLDRLGGYILEERGLIDIKGKGEVTTYFLIGEDPCFRALRKSTREEKIRENRRIPRSSLKVPKGLSRAASFESPKKLRFANNTMEFNPYQRTKLESITDNSPSKCLDVEFCDHLSVSCPCIENIQIRVNGEKPNEATSDPAIFVNDQIRAPLLSKLESHV